MDSVNSQPMLSRVEVSLLDNQQGDELMAPSGTPIINVSEDVTFTTKFVEIQCSRTYSQVTVMAGSVVMEGQAEIPEYEVLLRSVMYSMSRFTCPLSRHLQVTVYSGNR